MLKQKGKQGGVSLSAAPRDNKSPPLQLKKKSEKVVIINNSKFRDIMRTHL
jgi:hypothetical protein